MPEKLQSEFSIFFKNYVYSLFGDYSWQNFNFFTEVGQSKSGGIGAVGGMVASLSSKLETAIALRSLILVPVLLKSSSMRSVSLFAWDLSSNNFFSATIDSPFVKATEHAVVAVSRLSISAMLNELN